MLQLNGKLKLRNLTGEVNVVPNSGDVSGTKQITENGEYGVALFEKVNVNVPPPEGYFKPEGTALIQTNGIHDVAGYAQAAVDVPIPDGYLQPTGTKEITENGTHDAAEYEKVEVNVPPPEGFIQPEGTLTITENGTHDVSEYASAEVNIPATEPKLQTKVETITENGLTTITPDEGFDGLSEVDIVVNVEGGTGGGAEATLTDKTITKNGVYFATEDGADGFSSVTVNVPASGGSGECSGEHVIEVDELPTENIDGNALYKCGDSYHQYVKEIKDIFVVQSDGVVSFVDMYTGFGATVELYYVDTKPTENIKEFSEADMLLPIYYVADENDLFFYIEGGWMALSVLMGITNGGAISDVSEATTLEYYYALIGVGWKSLILPNGSITITEVGTVDVTKYESAAIKIASVYTVQTVDELPTDATNGSLAIVLGGE